MAQRNFQENKTTKRYASAQAADKKPNIIVIMGDDIGWFNLGSYN